MSVQEGAISLRGVRFTYDAGRSWALDGVSLDIRAGEWVAIAGPNGSGKSTLARVIAGLVAPDAGDVTLAGQRACIAGEPDPAAYRAARRLVGAVFQNPADQIVTTTVEDDVAFGPENLGVDPPGIGERIARSLDAVSMQDARHGDPTRMSGGQQQRVAIAGQLAMDASILVLDEPTAMLDPDARADVMRTVRAIHDAGTTVVFVTHHRDEIDAAERVIRLEEGRIVPSGTAPGTALPEVNVPPSTSGNPPLDADMVHTPGAAASEPAISFSHVTFRYGDAQRPALDDVTVSVGAGETVALIGRNGSGKTTFARLAAGLETPQRGSIRVCGIDVATAGRRTRTGRERPSRQAGRRQRMALHHTLGYVMQHPERQLFADTVAQDVAFGPRSQGLGEQAVQERVGEALELLGIAPLAQRSPMELSGGQQRLAAIAGVIACHPSLLVLDEPTAGLDERACARIGSLIEELKRRGVAVLLVTHAMDEANRYADRIVLFGDGPQDAGWNRHGLPVTRVNATPLPAAAQAAEASEHASSQERYSWVSSLDPRAKSLGFLALMFSAFAMSRWPQLAVGFAVCAALVALAHIKPSALLRSVHMFLAMFVIMGALNVFFVRSGTPLAHIGPLAITDDGVSVAVLYMLRFSLVIVLGALLLATTTPTALTDAFESALAPLKAAGVHTQEIALVLSLALRFLPTLGAEAKSILEAQQCRGGSVESGSPSKRIRALCAIVVPVFAAALRHADNLSLALDARCYEDGISRTHWRRYRFDAHDWLFLALAAAQIAALVALAHL